MLSSFFALFASARNKWPCTAYYGHKSPHQYFIMMTSSKRRQTTTRGTKKEEKKTLCSRAVLQCFSSVHEYTHTRRAAEELASVATGGDERCCCCSSCCCSCSCWSCFLEIPATLVVLFVCRCDCQCPFAVTVIVLRRPVGVSEAVSQRSVLVVHHRCRRPVFLSSVAAQQQQQQQKKRQGRKLQNQVCCRTYAC